MTSVPIDSGATAERQVRMAGRLRSAFGRSDRPPSRGFRVLSVLTAVNLYALVVIGGVVRTTGSGLGCDNGGRDNGWPLCQGRLLPPLEQHALIEFSHRWLAATGSMLLIGLLAVVWLRYRHLRLLSWVSTAVIALLVVQITLGQITVAYSLPGEIVMAHLANAELIVAAAVLICVLAFTGGGADIAQRARSASPSVRRAAAWSLAASIATYVLVVSGAWVVARGAGLACDGWPLCGSSGFSLTGTLMAEYNLAHRGIVAVVVVLIGISLARALRAHGNRPAIRATGLVIATILIAQVVAGAAVVDSGLAPALRSLHEALASALWAAVVLMAILTRPGVLPDGSPTARRVGATTSLPGGDVNA